ncbi:hypothetical protein [Bacteroidetes bacterium endosymbiont of Geopemphigus sp.]|uniref:hypothetical protein n=1 Tax=Bacteroidetes bacterium endosymbiont of Geopemphigus sp. TaxID=2047937 RepID=UPI000CD1E04C|nr:hypothetical protein [Bacteroidetes bacterium endosymbiont of Geopemphigus sp.]
MALSKKKILFRQSGSLLSYFNGDDRELLNTLEFVVSMLSEQSVIEVDDTLVRKSLAQKSVCYDKAGAIHMIVPQLLLNRFAHRRKMLLFIGWTG